MVVKIHSVTSTVDGVKGQVRTLTALPSHQDFWLGSTAILDAFKRYIHCTYWESNYDSSEIQLAVWSLYGISTPTVPRSVPSHFPFYSSARVILHRSLATRHTHLLAISFHIRRKISLVNCLYNTPNSVLQFLCRLLKHYTLHTRDKTELEFWATAV
jgi:hypothetical protein